VDTVRAIWNDTLKGMFVNQDLDALRQLFS
jgi:hypothetical protein